MLAPVKDHQTEKADKCKPRCDSVDATGPSMRFLIVHRRRRGSREYPDYHARDGQVANPVVLHVLRYLGAGRFWIGRPSASRSSSPIRGWPPGPSCGCSPCCCNLRIRRIAAAGVIFGHSVAIAPLRHVVTAAFDQNVVSRISSPVTGRAAP